MITLQELKWDNCFSYGEGNELDLSSTTLTQIIGTNGTGKSSIPLIIEEALYNKNSKGIKKADIANRYVNNGYNIYLSFTKDSSLYEITVNRKNSVKLKLQKDGEDISSHTATNTYKSLQEILGIDFKTFSQLVYQSTNASLQFLTATDTNRKKFLIDLLHLEKYVSLFEVFKNAHRGAVNDRSTLSGKLATVVKWLENNILDDSNILPMLNLEIDTSENEKALRSLMIELQNISEKNKKILQNNQYKKMLRAIPIHDLQQSTATWTDYDDLIQEQGTYQADVIQSRKLISKLDALGQKCPTCEQHISYNVKNSMIDEAAEKANAAEEKVNDLKRRIKSIKSENAEFTNTKNRITEWEDLYRNIDQNLQGDILDKHELETRIQVLQRDIQSAKDELARTATENERRTKRNTRIQIIQEQTDAFQREKIEYENTLAKQQRIETNLEILKKSFSTNGLIAYKIESLVKELEELVNKYLGELSDGRFTLHFVVSNDKLNVEITDNGNVVDISALSSGELARVNTATLIAIRKLMSSISKSKINILFLDEVINVLDDTGREKIVEVLLQEDELNTYIVSHGWTHPLLEKIEVVRKGNVSGLEW
jgi:DNA repair exonuclease SbcCD ATPase subunit|tara:strand:+ start:17966 stop:19762 length:1797 start_codon:yes stop_codon:yes gene_type:complete